MPKLSKPDLAILLALTLLASALRLYRLDAPLWYDEILTLLDYVRLPLGQIVSTYESLNNHILFSVQSNISVAVFGESAWAVRLPAALFGIATVPLLWFLVRGIGAPSRYAHVSALLLAFNYHHIWFSQNARGYTGLVFWCLLALFLVTRARRGGNPCAWAGVAFSGTLAMYTHLSAAFFLAALFLAALLAEVTDRKTPGSRRRNLALLASFTGMAVLVLALYLPILRDILSTVTAVTEPEVAAPKANPLSKWESPVSALVSALADLPGPLILAVIAIPLAGVIFVAGWLRVRSADAVTAWTIPLSIVVTIGLLVAAGMRIWPRFFLADVVLFLVLATFGVSAIADFVARGSLAKGLTRAGWAVGILISAIWGFQNYSAPKQDFAGGMALAEDQAMPEDRFATFGLSALPVVRYYNPGWSVLESPDALDRALAGPAPLWIVVGFEDHSRAHFPGVFDRIDADFDRVAKLPGTLGGGTVLVYRSRLGTNGTD